MIIGQEIGNYRTLRQYATMRFPPQAKMVQWSLKLPKPIGVLACNDFPGQHVLEACRVAQISVPDQVAVIGVDHDQVTCDFCQPSLSSVIPAADRIGYEAARMLDQLMRNEELASDMSKSPHWGSLQDNQPT